MQNYSQKKTDNINHVKYIVCHLLLNLLLNSSLKYQGTKAFQSLAKQWDVVHLVRTIFGRGLKNIWCPSQYLQKGNAAALFYSFFVKSVFLLTASLLL